MQPGRLCKARLGASRGPLPPSLISHQTKLSGQFISTFEQLRMGRMYQLCSSRLDRSTSHMGRSILGVQQEGAAFPVPLQLATLR